MNMNMNMNIITIFELNNMVLCKHIYWSIVNNYKNEGLF